MHLCVYIHARIYVRTPVVFTYVYTIYVHTYVIFMYQWWSCKWALECQLRAYHNN